MDERYIPRADEEQPEGLTLEEELELVKQKLEQDRQRHASACGWAAVEHYIQDKEFNG